MTGKEAVSPGLPESPGLLGAEGRGNADYVTDKESVLGLNKGARTYVRTAINTGICIYICKFPLQPENTFLWVCFGNMHI